ncbi:MAG: hypothetical protein ACI9JN_001934 [Bacteroidia bacterium]
MDSTRVFPRPKSINVTGFSVNNEGYFGNGKSGSNTLTDKFWKYNVSKNSWTAIASLPGTKRRITNAFVLNDVPYVGCGTNSGTSVSTFLNDFYAYDYKKDKWTRWSSNDNFTPRISPHFFVIGDSAVYTVAGYGKNGSLASWWKLATEKDTCDYFDTTVVTVNDTTFHHAYDTTFTTIYDTIVYQVYDTSFVTIYDTVQRVIYDTSHVIIYDTSYITIVDTSYLTIYDTTHINVYDTIIRTIYRSVDDTLVVGVYVEGCGDIDINIYPNPSSDLVYVFTRHDDCLTGKEIRMYDDIGRLVRRQTIYSNRTAVDVRGLAAAVYVLKVMDTAGTTIIAKKILIL